MPGVDLVRMFGRMNSSPSLFSWEEKGGAIVRLSKKSLRAKRSNLDISILDDVEGLLRRFAPRNDCLRTFWTPSLQGEFVEGVTMHD